MARQRFDIGSKWLLQNQGKGALLVGGLKAVERIEPLPGEIVQNRKLPDGLLRVFLQGENTSHLVLVEVATYAEKRAWKQALDDLTLAYNTFGRLPELLMLVLSPKGRLRIRGNFEVRSHLGLASLTAVWKSVELWKLSAEEFLTEGDAGVVPWIPLMRFDGKPETLLERCAEKIEREARPKDRADLLAVTEVLGGLRFPLSLLAEVLRGATNVIESPVLQQWKAESLHQALLDLLKDRFVTVPRDVTKQLRKLVDEKKLRKLIVLAAKCPDLDTWRTALPL